MTKARDLANAGTALTSVSATELGYLDGVTSAVQTQLNQKPEFTAGKNKIINGDFGVWQRGTSFSNPGSGVYTADRFKTTHNGTGATRTISQQTFTLGTAPVAGYEGQYFLRYNVSVAGSSNTFQGIVQAIEDVRTFANQTATISFWAKADSARTLAINLVQVFGSGGSSSVFATLTPNEVSLTTAWQRFTINASVPSIAGKTIGSGNALDLRILPPANTVCTVDIWGVQVEAGSTATAFTTASGNPNLEITASGTVVQDGILFSSNASSNPSGSGTNSWAGYQVAGKNKIINGDFGVWQRGTSFAGLTTSTYTSDRWSYVPSGATATVTQQTFTPGTAPVAGYEAPFFIRVEATVANDLWGIFQKIEDVRTFAGQAVTFSFWAKTATAQTLNVNLNQSFGSGGSADVTALNTTFTSSTSWARYTFTATIPSIAGKTVGANSNLQAYIRCNDNATGTLDVWGVQLEAGSIATPFTTATGTVQGELAACQRYYQYLGGGGVGSRFVLGNVESTTATQMPIALPVPMRTTPTFNIFGIGIRYAGTNDTTISTVSGLGSVGGVLIIPLIIVASAVLTLGQAVIMRGNAAGPYITFDAEL